MTIREDSYREIIYRFLIGYYFYCRHTFNLDGYARKWIENEHESSAAHEDIYEPNKSPIERLMLEIIYFIVNERRKSDDFLLYTQMAILEILKDHALGEFLIKLPKNERSEFKADLWLCGFYKNATTDE